MISETDGLPCGTVVTVTWCSPAPSNPTKARRRSRTTASPDAATPDGAACFIDLTGGSYGWNCLVVTGGCRGCSVGGGVRLKTTGLLGRIEELGLTREPLAIRLQQFG
jgi:hypothetical protein